MEKYITYKNTKIFYRVYKKNKSGGDLIKSDGTNEKTILFLHGWGGNAHSFASVEPFFIANYNCIFISFPCFQKNDCEGQPASPFELNDYMQLMLEVLENEGVKLFHIIAHSFGARVAVLLSNFAPDMIDKLVLTGPAGIHPRFNLIKKCRILWHKMKRKLFKSVKNSENKGSADYRNLTLNGKITFQNIIKTNLENQIAGIKQPALIIWGTNDTAIRHYMVKRWTKLNLNTKLIIYKNAGHFCFLDSPNRFIINAQDFLKEN